MLKRALVNAFRIKSIEMIDARDLCGLGLARKVATRV